MDRNWCKHKHSDDVVVIEKLENLKAVSLMFLHEAEKTELTKFNEEKTRVIHFGSGRDQNKNLKLLSDHIHLE